MAIQVLMPKIGLTMTEGKIVEWKKKEGERVETGEVLFVFETEKVTFEVEAAQSGYLAKILAPIDATVQIGETVGLLVEKEGERADSAGEPPEANLGEVKNPVREIGEDRGEKIRATPMARRIARERGIDLGKVSASSPGERIRMTDVDAALETNSPGEGVSGAGEGKMVKLSGMRSAIAERMLAGKRETAQTYMAISVDAKKIVESRETLAPMAEKSTGVHITITDILMKITASAISRHPVMNTRWTKEGILWLEPIHMGMAMALEEGLVVPVIPDIGRKTLFEIAQSRSSVVEKGKKGKLTPDEITGSTFTLSSLGMYGIEEFTSIINIPESAILAVGAILDKPVVINKEIVVRPVMKITLSYDHRVIDGAKAAAFMMTLKGYLENPSSVIA
jgi:pyruvate dehydrogenase E2 component (dihydrolipoamide acetyltransferase)